MTDSGPVLKRLMGEQLTKDFLCSVNAVQKRAYQNSKDHGFWDILEYIDSMVAECIMSPHPPPQHAGALAWAPPRRPRARHTPRPQPHRHASPD